MLADLVGADLTTRVSGATVGEALDDLFSGRPILRGHLLDEAGEIRPHVAVFVNGTQARLDTSVPEHATVHVLHAVSGG